MNNHQVQTTNAISISSTLPSKQNHTNLLRKTTEQIAKHASSYNNIIHQDDNNIQHQQFFVNDKNNKKSYIRPTYGAYTNNTLPRGPYLQYKYSDRQPISLLSTTSTNSVAAPATAATINQTRKISEYFDNNKLQQNRQIEQLKNEFIHLPRAKICINEQQKSPANKNRNEQADRFFIDDRNDDGVGNSGNVRMVQTLGRYKQFPNHKNEITANHQGISNLEYFYSNNHHVDIGSSNRESIQRNHFNERQHFNEYENHRSIVKSKSLGNCAEQFFSNTKSSTSTNQNHQNPYYKELVQVNDIESNHFVKKQQSNPINNCQTATTTTVGMNRNRVHGQMGMNSVNGTINFVTLADVIKHKSTGLNQMDGWALLCQSVQALQDLFLSDTPSTARILPLVHPSNLQITSRGRVVFNILPTSLNDVSSYISFLSPEYLNSVGKKITFIESDIEKMWIYSLGITLRRTIQSTSGTSLQRKMTTGANGAAVLLNYQNDNGNTMTMGQRIKAPAVMTMVNHQANGILDKNGNGSENLMKNHYNKDKAAIAVSSSCDTDNVCVAKNMYKNLTSLEYVIRTMCAPNIHYRASLMYLLDAISQYCRYYHQIKPFSHIAIDLFKETVDNLHAKNLIQVNERKLMIEQIASGKDEQKSDTDSGRSSIHGEKEPSPKTIAQPSKPISQLKVTRCTDEKLKALVQSEHQKVNIIGNDEHVVNEVKTIEPLAGTTGRLQVIRRKDAILRRRNMHRRNTIDVNQFDMQRASTCANFGYNFNASKSTNCLDNVGAQSSYGFQQRIDQMNLNGTSMPELNKEHKFATLPNIRVRRPSRVIVGNHSSDEDSHSISSIKSKGPEFIMNSSLACHEIDITDIKCQHRRAVNVLLLNGRSMNITCSSSTTTARQVLETVIKSENFVENFFLGLCALIGGDFVFLPSDLKIHKVAPQIWGSISKRPNYGENVIFTLFLRIKFFLPNLRGISSLESRHLLYLQLRKSILESQILCTDDDLITLGGLALQAEVGDFKQVMKFNDYFTISHYLPEGVYQRNKEMAKYLRNSHFCKRGLHSKEAEQQFIRYVQEMKEYGLHLYSAIWTMENNTTHDVYVAISLNGIAIFERSSRISADKQIECGENSKTTYQRKLYANFDWLEIENLCFSKHVLCVVVRKSDSLKAKDNNRVKYKFKMDGRKSYFAFNLASEHHKFYMKLRDSFISLKHISNELNIPLVANQNRTKTPDIFPSDYTPPDKSTESPSSSNDKVIADKNIKIIDKQTKTTGMRVRNLKKSMLNDNKLIKLRNKLLKRSKSTVGISSKCSDLSNEKTESGSKEEYQNKENELPKTSLIQEPQQSQQPALPPKLMSPNRNRVKMGTRVFSSQFLNKSFDNIYDNAIDIYHFDDDILNDDIIQQKYKVSHSSAKCKPITTDNFNVSCRSEASANGKCCEQNDLATGSCDDGLSLKSTSLSSLYFSEKMSEKFSESPLPSEAYVIHSSIKSTSDANFFGLQNETISETLLDKFNDLTASSSISDRIITRITIKKDSLNKLSLNNEHKLQLAQYQQQQNQHSKYHNLNQIKYATMNSRKMVVKECDNDKAKELFLSRSQESVFEQKSADHCINRRRDAINQFDSGGNNITNNINVTQTEYGLTLGISIVQGSDNNVYVKDLVKNGPGARHGIQIGDQILAVNGTSLLNLPYDESLKLLQNTGKTVELIVSQIFHKHQQQQQKQQKQQCTETRMQCNGISYKSPKTDSDDNNHTQSKNVIKYLENNIMEQRCSTSYNSDTNNKYQRRTAGNDVARSTCNRNENADDDNDNSNLNAIMHSVEYMRNIRYDTHEPFLYNEEKFIMRNGCENRIREYDQYRKSDKLNKIDDSYLVSAKSMPDLPKVVAIIPKNAVKTAIPKLMGQSRKYVGPIKYPVTPIRATINGENQRLSLLADDDEQQVYI